MEKRATLKEAFEEAKRRGFEYYIEPQTGITTDLEQTLDELGTDEAEEPEYTIFGNFIIRMTDAWKPDAEIYELCY